MNTLPQFPTFHIPESTAPFYHRSHSPNFYPMDSSSSSSPSPHKPLNWLFPLSHLPTAPTFCPRTANEDDDDSIDDRQNNNAINESAVALGVEVAQIPKQLLFEKPLTPSDVGKLNRLVIPKQHAEKCFPLNGSGGGESAENGLLLSFQDELGKSWRFRYSYWNSSQSYVLTKGWSRFVKEKRLDAGDIVVFSRHRAEAGRLFIGWKRRNSIGTHDQANLAYPTNGGSGGWNRIPYSGDPYYRYYQQLAQSNLNPPNQQPEHCPLSGSMVQTQPGTTAASAVSGNSKRLRLFGVNLECQAAEESEPASTTPLDSSMSTEIQNGHYSYHHPHHHYYSNYMEDDTYRQG